MTDRGEYLHGIEESKKEGKKVHTIESERKKSDKMLRKREKSMKKYAEKTIK